MNLRLLAAATLLAVIGCYGPTPGQGTVHYDGSFSQGDVTHNDAGTDGGSDGGDAGSDGGFDGGCVHASNSGAGVIDNCFAPNTGPQAATIVESACGVAINWGTGNCTGALSGPANAFDGGCLSYASCTAPSIPGTITCIAPGVSSCAIQVCDGGTCTP